MARWKSPYSSYSDPVLREFGRDISEVLQPKERLHKYRVNAIGRLERLVNEAMTPRFPGAAEALTKSANAEVVTVARIPEEPTSANALAGRIMDRWMKEVQIAPSLQPAILGALAVVVRHRTRPLEKPKPDPVLPQRDKKRRLRR